MHPLPQEKIKRTRSHPNVQRQRILDAAQACFVEHGFHAAGMSAVAKTAGMSPGLIYRYFSSKSEIILAIIERQLEFSREEIANLECTRASMPEEIWASVIECAECSDARRDRLNPALHAEMSAEASRNPEIAAATSASDAALREEFSRRLQQSGTAQDLALPRDDARAVALLLQCLVDGMRLRQLREPGLDLAEAKHALDVLLPSWLEPRGR